MDNLHSLCHCICTSPYFLYKARSNNGQVNLTSTLSPCSYTSKFHKPLNSRFHPNLRPFSRPNRKVLHSKLIRYHYATKDWHRDFPLHSCYGSLVETKRLQTAKDDLISKSVWWLVPQYVIFGVSDVFTMVGLQDFFYDQVPSELRSVGMALNLSIYGAGNFLSSFMISVIDKITSQSGQKRWFDNDLNQAHLDYFYWLLACFSFIGLASYLWFAKSYVYNRPNTFLSIVSLFCHLNWAYCISQPT